MISSKAKYALRAALLLAQHYDDAGWTQNAELAEAGDIPRKFLEAILVELRDQGIVVSRRGPGGGHRLAEPPESIMAGEVIRIVEGQLALTPCSSRRQFRACADCVEVHSCPLRQMMLRARDAVAGVLDTCSLADLAAGQAGHAPTPPRRRAAKAAVKLP